MSTSYAARQHVCQTSSAIGLSIPFKQYQATVTVVDLREALVGLFIVGVLVGVVLEGKLAVRPLDLILRRALGHLQHVVVALPAPPPSKFQSNRKHSPLNGSGVEHTDLNPMYQEQIKCLQNQHKKPREFEETESNQQKTCFYAPNRSGNKSDGISKKRREN